MNRFYDNFNLLEQKDDKSPNSDYLDKYNSVRNQLFSPAQRTISVMIESDHTQKDKEKLKQLKQSNKIIRNVIGYTLNSVAYDYIGGAWSLNDLSGFLGDTIFQDPDFKISIEKVKTPEIILNVKDFNSTIYNTYFKSNENFTEVIKINLLPDDIVDGYIKNIYEPDSVDTNSSGGKLVTTLNTDFAAIFQWFIYLRDDEKFLYKHIDFKDPKTIPIYKPYSRVDIILPDLPDNNEVISNLYEYNIIGSIDVNTTSINNPGSIGPDERSGAGSNNFYPIDVDIKKLKIKLLFKDPNLHFKSDENLYDMNENNPYGFRIRNIKLTLTTITNIKSINN
jgi:hypothetical protein